MAIFMGALSWLNGSKSPVAPAKVPTFNPRFPTPVIMAAQAAQAKWRVPACTQLAQWAIESGYGAHSPGNNPFGMKPRAGHSDPCQMLATTEWSQAKGYYKVDQPFRTFTTVAAAFDAHAELIATAPVYAPAMAALPAVNAFIDRMAAHYATDPAYASKLKAMIATNNLTQYDEVA